MVETKQSDLDEQIKQESANAGGSPWKPITGRSADGFFGIGKSTVLQDQNSSTGWRDAGITALDSRYGNTANNTSAMIGDYVVTKNGLVPAKNSITDWVNRYAVVTGGTAKKGLSFSDWMDAAGNAIGAFNGMPTDASSDAAMIGTTIAGQLAKTNPVTRAIWTIGNFIGSLSDAQRRYNEEWANTMVDYSSAVSFVDDGNGGLKAVIDYSKIPTAGKYGSGEGILNATNTNETKAEMTDDNRLKITASKAFVESSAYKDVVDKLYDSLMGLTKEQANEVVDQDTGKTRLQMIESYVKSAESNFYYNANSIKTLKESAPTASEEALSRGSYTMLAGYVNDDALEDMEISIYDKDNNLQEVNAKEWLDSVKNMSKTERNDYMLSLGDRVSDANISDDEKAVLQAQANALYAASAADGEYKGIYAKDFWDTIGDTKSPIFGFRLGDYGKIVGGYGELSTFTNDEVFSGLLQLGSSFVHVRTMSKLVNGIEKLERFGVGKLGTVIGDNKVGNFLKNINGFAPQDVGQSLPAAIAESTGLSSFAKNVGAWTAKTATQVGMQMAADISYEGAKALVANMTGNDFNFLNELKTDLILDSIMTYGPTAYNDAMHGNGEKVEYRPIKGPNGEYLTTRTVYDTEMEKYDEQLSKATEAGDVAKVEEIKQKIEDLGDRPNEGERAMELVKVTAQQLSQERAAKIDKLTDSKIGQTVQKLFFDKNMAMNKLAVQVLKVTGDSYLFKKMLRASGDIKALTRWSETEFRRNYGENLKNLGDVLKRVAPRNKDLTQDDIDYLNAKGNRERLIKKADGNDKIIAKIKATYDPAIKKVSAERAAELDELRAAMAKVASDILANYKQKGIMDDAMIKRIAAYKGYYPVWSKTRAGGGEIKQTRATAKNIFDPNEIIRLEELENPIVSLASEVNNMARNIAINERALAIREAASIAGVDIHLYKDTGGGLREVTNLRELNAKFEKRYQNIRKVTLEEFPDKKAWQEENDKMVLSSKALKKHSDYEKLQTESKDLVNRLRRQQRALKKAGTKKEAEDLSRQVFETKAEIEANRQAQALLIDEIRAEAAKTIRKAAKNSKAPMELDIKSYVNIQVTKMIKSALKQNNSQGALQAALNEMVEKANPWVDPELVIQTRAEAAAEDFRKKVNKEMTIKKSAHPTDSDRLNAIADRVTDYVVKKALGKQGTSVQRIDEDLPTRSYATGGKKNQIHYKLNGEEYTMTLTGKGAEELVEEFNRPEAKVPKTVAGKIGNRLLRAGNEMAQAKRYLTTSSDPSRVLPNLLRDWSRGIVTTGGLILLSPADLRTEAIESGKLNDEAIARMDQGWRTVADNIKGSTFTKSMEVPKKNRMKSMRAALSEPDGEGFVVYTLGRTLKETAKESRVKYGGGKGEKWSILQDTAETFTRMRAMTNAYYDEVGKSVSKGMSIDEAIERGMESAYFSGIESTVNFSRRGLLIEKLAQQVPYLTQRFATLESFKNAWMSDPIAVSRSLKTTVTAYASMIAILLSNEASRKRYYMLSEYDRANNIILSLDNEHIITIPLDDTIAAFLTPYRRAIETLNGVDPEAFYLWGVEFLEALSPLDLSGFSEGDSFNIVRGMEKLGSQLIPTWAQPFVEAATGRDLYYGTDISMNEEKVGEYYGIYNPTPAQMTSKSKNSRHLGLLSNALGIPQWILQNTFAEYGGNVGQYAIALLDKLSGATQEEQGGKELLDAIFKPFTGNDSSQVEYAFNEGMSLLQEKKKKLQNELATINTQLKTAVGEDRANILNHRQEIINKYGTEVTDYLNEYLSAYEITGGLTQKQANRVWYLYVLYDDNANLNLMSNIDDYGENYYYSKAKTLENRRATALAAVSGLDKYIDGRTRDPNNDYYETYGAQAFQNTVYGSNMGYVNQLYRILEKNEGNESGKSYYDLRQEMYDDRSKAYDRGDFTAADAIAYEYDKKILAAVSQYIEKTGRNADDVINNSQVIDYLKDWIAVPNSFMKTKKGKYVPSLMPGAQKEQAFKKAYIKYLFGIEED